MKSITAIAVALVAVTANVHALTTTSELRPCPKICHITKPHCRHGEAPTGGPGCWGCCQPVHTFCPAVCHFQKPKCRPWQVATGGPGCWGCCVNIWKSKVQRINRFLFKAKFQTENIAWFHISQCSLTEYVAWKCGEFATVNKSLNLERVDHHHVVCDLTRSCHNFLILGVESDYNLLSLSVQQTIELTKCMVENNT